jgi:hypothetical protein
MTCVLGHQFSDHNEACTRAKKGVAKARVDKYRGGTLLDVGCKKLKVFFEYDKSEDLGRVTIAKCMVKGNLPMMGVGVNHEKAANVPKEEVEDYFSTLKEQEDAVNKEQGRKEDKQALIDMFVELVKIDQENAIDYFLIVGGVETPVNTRMEFTKLGKVQIVAIMEMKGEVVTEIGSTRKEAVNNLAEKISQMESEKENMKSAKFCCVDCGSRFSKEVAFKLHQDGSFLHPVEDMVRDGITPATARTSSETGEEHGGGGGSQLFYKMDNLLAIIGFNGLWFNTAMVERSEELCWGTR